MANLLRNINRVTWSRQINLVGLRLHHCYRRPRVLPIRTRSSAAMQSRQRILTYPRSRTRSRSMSSLPATPDPRSSAYRRPSMYHPSCTKYNRRNDSCLQPILASSALARAWIHLPDLMGSLQMVVIHLYPTKVQATLPRQMEPHPMIMVCRTAISMDRDRQRAATAATGNHLEV